MYVPCKKGKSKMQEYRVNGSMIITFDLKYKHYGNGFVVSKKWQESIHKYWRKSDRICVLQLSGNPDTFADGPQYQCKPTGKCRIKISRIKMKPKNIINIINVYAPTSTLKSCIKTQISCVRNLIKHHHPLLCWLGISTAKQEDKLGPKAVLGNSQEADEIRMVQTWQNSVKRMVNASQAAASNTLQSTLQPGRKEKLTR